jgi:hypothetical protein
VKLFLAIDHFLPNFTHIGQIFSPLFLAKNGHLIYHSIPNLMLNLKIFLQNLVCFLSFKDIQILVSSTSENQL